MHSNQHSSRPSNREGSQKIPAMWKGAVAACLVLVGTAFFGLMIHTARTVQTMADPEARRAQALEFMDAAELPNRYETAAAIRVPFFADVAVLQGDAARLVVLGGLRTEADLEAAFDDEESLHREARRAGLAIDDSVLLDSGGFDVSAAAGRSAAEVRFVVLEGKAEFDVTASSYFDFEFGEIFTEEAKVDAEVTAFFLVRCLSETRVGLWMGPRLQAFESAGDETAVRGLFEQFGICSASAGKALAASAAEA